MALTTGSSSGTQTSTDTPQSATSDNGLSGARSSGVQPGTASSLLNQPAGNTVGVPLGQAQLSTVSLNAPATTTATVAQPRVLPHHVNWGLFSLSGILLLLAVGLFWSMSRSAQAEKNTTK